MTNPESDQNTTSTPELSPEQKFDQVCEGFRYDMYLWESRIQEAYDRGDMQLAQSIQDDALDILDEAWPFHEEQVLIVGKWWSPVLDINPDPEDGAFRSRDYIAWEFEETPISAIAISTGVGWQLDNGRVRLGFSFSLGKTLIQKPFISMEVSPIAVALPDKTSLTYVPPLDENNGIDILRGLKLEDSLARLYITRPEFTQLHASKQRRQIEGIFERTNIRISKLFGRMVIGFQTSSLYVHNEPSTPYGFEKKSDLEAEEAYSVAGRLLGVGILEQAILRERAIREGDFIDQDAGLCLIIQPMNIANAPEIYVPYGATNIEETLDSATTED